MNEFSRDKEFNKTQHFESKPEKTGKKKKWFLRWFIALSILIPITVFIVFKGLLMILPKAQGEVHAEKTVILQTKVEGYLSKVHVSNSQNVKKDEVLFEFDNNLIGLKLDESITLNQDLEDKLRRNTAELEHIEKGIERARILFENDIISKFEMEGMELAREKEKGAIQDLKREIEVVQKRISGLKEDKESLIVKAPFNGVFLGELNEREGTYFQKGESFGILFSPEKFFLEAEFLEKDSVRIKVGDRSEISFRAYPGTYQGEVIEIEEKAKEVVEKVYKVKNIVKVKILLNSFPDGLKPGMQADVKILGRSNSDISLNFLKMQHQ